MDSLRQRTIYQLNSGDIYQSRDKLTSFDGVALFNERVIIPPSLRDKVLQALHSDHHGLISSLRRTFTTFGISDELSSHGSPEFTSTASSTFLGNWGVHHRLSSVAFPHSNSRAEIGVKTIKRLIIDRPGRDGCLDTDSIQRAILQCRNTPDRDTRFSLAMCIFGRPIRDFIPIHPGKYLPHKTWQQKREHPTEKRLSEIAICEILKDFQLTPASYPL
ncbi:hypothetical protein PoB_001703600 [Plakobranchus ocellatus]|uniref:Integrase catalytic domain-containing protein n=1 Tax=Plakobranchus ocellatus TaxID=259542 RepID=A0AAV3YTW0_9GAST|nr:hypothetical protein PoB_001703600 [Plakobranchus ocellatus]